MCLIPQHSRLRKTATAQSAQPIVIAEIAIRTFDYGDWRRVSYLTMSRSLSRHNLHGNRCNKMDHRGIKVTNRYNDLEPSRTLGRSGLRELPHRKGAQRNTYTTQTLKKN